MAEEDIEGAPVEIPRGTLSGRPMTALSEASNSIRPTPRHQTAIPAKIHTIDPSDRAADLSPLFQP